MFKRHSSARNKWLGADRAARRRQGVILLVVLSVLVLFVLMTVTFVLVASKEQSTAKEYARAERSGDSPRDILESIALTLFRDTNDKHSPFRSWSLLEGIYGNTSFRGQVGSQAQALGGGQMISFNVANNSTAPTTATSPPLSPAALLNGTWTYFPNFATAPTNYYRGCVLTMISGKLAGLSTRIVASTGANPGSGLQANTLTVMQFQPDTTDSSGNVPPPEFNAAASGSFSATFVINSPAYGGMGRGYDPTGASAAACGLLDKNTYTDAGGNNVNQSGWEYALTPNPVRFTASNNYADPGGPGGDNPDYTACDFNSMYLATVGFDATGNMTVIPSFHRPDLNAYWLKRIGGAVPDELIRKVLFRPYAVDHPLFFQSTNHNFDATKFDTTYDVDNLGLGKPDSIWIDPGLPVMTSRDGRTYKILVAPLILDMDGRLNLNAHGSNSQADSNYGGQYSGPLAGNANSANLPTGFGTGPANINPIQPQLLSASDFKNVLGIGAKNSNTAQGRHGLAGSPTANKQLTTLRFFDHQPDTYMNTSGTTSYGSPSDVKDRRAIGVDLRGQPIWLVPGAAATAANYWRDEIFGFASGIDNPYGIDLGWRVPRPGRQVPPGLDNPFTVAELERVLRQYDADAPSMPVRLYNLIQGSLQSNPSLALKLTVESWDVATPSLAVSHEMRGSGQGQLATAGSFTDLIKAKLAKTGVTAANVPGELTNILPPEVFAGQKMDINRPFGNGRNNRAPATINGTVQKPYPPIPVTSGSDHGIVDEVLDGGSTATAFGSAEALPGPNGLPFWPSAFPNSVGLNLTDGAGASDPLIANTAIPPGWKQRQLMARYLYVMMMAFADPTYVNWFDGTKDATAQKNAQELTARRVAQWAINAVCFRDSSSAMIPFVYHSQIFQSGYTGWQVNGDPGDPSQPKSISDWRVVWGCKPPDLLLTETLAFHDLRVADTDKDDNKKAKTTDPDPAKKDPDYDQIRIPQGTAFLELYCPRNPNNPIAPGDLYTLIGGQWVLDLGRMVPDGQGNPNVYPVWRMAISKSKGQNGGAANIDMAAQLQSNPETVVAKSDPSDNGAVLPSIQVNMFDNSQVVKIDRMIWLGSSPPPMAQRAGVFYNRNKQVSDSAKNPNTIPEQTYVQAGGYAVVGPRAVTYLGSTNPNGTGPWGTPSPQSISLYPTVGTKATSNDLAPPTINNPTGVIVAADPPAAWTDAGHQKWGVGLNVSEPLPSDPAYYPEPMNTNAALTDPVTGAPVTDGYGDLTGTDATKPFPDKPLETGAAPKLPTAPIVQDNINKTGTTPTYKTVFLQRLADPSLPFDPLRNPYITVDWMPIDLTVFNGEEDPNAGLPMKGNPDDPGALKPQVELYARQRGGSDPTKPPMPKTYNVWTPVNQNDAFPTIPTPVGMIANANFPYPVGHTLGYLNLNFGPGYGNIAGGGQAPPQPQYLGDPPTAFPWITWNARPYISAAELMLVPASSPDRLLAEFASLETPSPSTTSITNYQPYTQTQPNVRGPFPYLLNFFNSSDTSFAPTTASNYFRIFDYVQVPSKFIGTETVLSPKVFTANTQPVTGQPAPGVSLMPPFNTISNYRDPGRINVNTIVSQEVWNALLNQPNAPKPSYSDWVDSRRGDGGAGGLLTTSNTNLPTSFANPLRSASSADLVPVAAMLNASGVPRRGVDVTLLRSRPGGGGTLPLFMSTDVSAAANQRAPGGGDSAYNDASVDPYFAFQTLQRINNNVTGRSNVFAVWLTIGYFEVTPWTGASGGPIIDKGHPDGYQLGAELGSDNGTVERHRAFYMFDRSIPVGYERGMNHNVNRAILLKRFIE